jgi:chromosome partitioning protein
MTTIAFPNQSGGATKTTSTTSIGANLATKHHKKTRYIDGDLQCDTSHICGYTDPDEEENQANLIDVLSGDTALSEATVPVRMKNGKDEEANQLWRPVTNLSLVMGSIDLAAAERNLVTEIGGETRLQNALDEENDPEITNLIDCPASLGIVLVNILAAADYVIPCVKPGLKEIRALTKLEETIDKVNRNLRRGRPKLEIAGIIIADVPTSRQAGAVYDDAVKLVTNMYGSDIVLPRVARSVKVPESYAAQKPLPLYAPTCETAKNYEEMTKELIKRGLV